MNSLPKDRLLTADEAAGFLNISRKKLYRLINKGDLRASRVGGSWRISHAALMDFLKEGIRIDLAQ